MHSLIQQTFIGHFPICQALYLGWLLTNPTYRKTLLIEQTGTTPSLKYLKNPQMVEEQEGKKLIYHCQVFHENWARAEKQRSLETHLDDINKSAW